MHSEKGKVKKMIIWTKTRRGGLGHTTCGLTYSYNVTTKIITCEAIARIDCGMVTVAEKTFNTLDEAYLFCEDFNKREEACQRLKGLTIEKIINELY